MKVPVFATRLVWGVAMCLAFGGAEAARGYNVSPDQERAVTPGMSVEQVEQVLGRPEQQVKFRSDQGPTWYYRVIVDVNDRPKMFYVEFSSDGKVVSTIEQILPELANGQ